MDKIQDIMDDVAEQLQVSNEMSDLISSPIGGGKAHSYNFSFTIFMSLFKVNLPISKIFTITHVHKIAFDSTQNWCDSN